MRYDFKVIPLFILILTGCATQAPNPWEGLTVELTPATIPLDCGSFPVPAEATDSMFVYDVQGANDLNDYRQCSEDNEAIAGEHAKQINQLKIAKKALVEAGQSQRNIADLRQTMLEDERRHHFWSSIGYWIAIVGMGAAL